MAGEINAVGAPKKTNIPVVLTREEVKRVIHGMEGTPQLIVKILYGSGLRVTEALRLRVQDIDYQVKHIIVRSGKGAKDRVTTFPVTLIPLFENHLAKVKTWHNQDLASGYGEAYLPYALSRKYPKAAKEWNWQYVFPSRKLSKDPRSMKLRRHHVDPSAVNKAIQTVVNKLQLPKKISQILVEASRSAGNGEGILEGIFEKIYSFPNDENMSQATAEAIEQNQEKNIHA